MKSRCYESMELSMFVYIPTHFGVSAVCREMHNFPWLQKVMQCKKPGQQQYVVCRNLGVWSDASLRFLCHDNCILQTYAQKAGYTKLSSTIIICLGSSGDLESQSKDCIPVLLFLYLSAWPPWEFCKKLDSRCWHWHIHLLLKRIYLCMLCLINRQHCICFYSQKFSQILSVYSCWLLCSEFDFIQQEFFSGLCICSPWFLSQAYLIFITLISYRKQYHKKFYKSSSHPSHIVLKADAQKIVQFLTLQISICFPFLKSTVLFVLISLL